MIAGAALFLASIAIVVVERSCSRRKAQEAYKRGELNGTRNTAIHLTKTSE